MPNHEDRLLKHRNESASWKNKQKIDECINSLSLSTFKMFDYSFFFPLLFPIIKLHVIHIPQLIRRYGQQIQPWHSIQGNNHRSFKKEAEEEEDNDEAKTET